MHGAVLATAVFVHLDTDVTEIVWYITNERGEAVDFQKAFVSVTATLSWPDPSAPQLGSAEANMMIQDVDHAY